MGAIPDNRSRLFWLSVLALFTAAASAALRAAVAKSLRVEWIDPIAPVEAGELIGSALGSAFLGFAATLFVASALLDRIGSGRSLAVSGLTASAALLVAALGAHLVSASLLVAAIVLVTFAFGLGQPALSAAVGDAVAADVRGVALGISTLLFLVGGSVGSAVVAGLSGVVGMGGALLVLAVLPLLGLLVLAPTLRRTD